MIVCPFNPEVLLNHVEEAFYCTECLECRLLSGLFPMSFGFFSVVESEVEEE